MALVSFHIKNNQKTTKYNEVKVNANPRPTFGPGVPCLPGRPGRPGIPYEQRNKIIISTIEKPLSFL